MPSRSEDEFAETAAATPSTDVGKTATAAPSGPARPDEPRKLTSLGRLRIERELGSGGMGVVHAAFDPDLERRVAVKLLHASSADARARLLREARAMAKLSHPNVITVFDVGTADGVDFVTMELIDGVTLKDWLATTKPAWREIVAAFVAAGRGLAAAHDAGLVHRDFKPTNILRSTAGKIVVTDFGLSRATEGDVDPLATTGAISGPATRTQTGAVLGTPAYMAPEQWTGDNVGPASDQFAFCVALWEALAGGRPYRGDTLDELKTGVLAGPEKLPSDALPRPVRAIVLRGLATDPDKRWPSMHALLGALERRLARRRRVISLAAALAIGTVGTTALLVTRGGDSVVVTTCSPPALDPDAVWSQARADAIGKRDPASAKLLASDVVAWRKIRLDACGASPALRSPELACLDGVLARIDVASRLAETQPPGVEGTSSLLVDPAMCARTPAPHLLATIDPELAGALGQLRITRNQGKIVRGKLPDNDCARAVALRARLVMMSPTTMEFSELSGFMEDLKDAGPLADRCTDDALHAIILLGLANASSKDVERAAAAIAALPQDDLLAELDLLRGRELAPADPDTAIASFEKSIERFGKRSRPHGQLRAVTELLDALIARSRAADLARVEQLVARWRLIATGDDAPVIDYQGAVARWRRGDVDGADAQALAAGYAPKLKGARGVPEPVDVHGSVVDEAGRPVADAEVVASMELDSDAVHAAAPTEVWRKTSARTGADGTFAIHDAYGLIVASAGTQRSAFASVQKKEVKLVLHPTSRVEGHVLLGPLDGTQVRVTLSAEPKDVLYDAIAPVRPDGSFTLDHVLRGKMTLAAREYGIDSGDEPLHLTVAGDLRDVNITAQVAHPLYVIARNTGMTPPDAAIILLFAGSLPDEHATLTSLHLKANHPLGEYEAHGQHGKALPAIVRDRIQPDDFMTKIPTRPTGKMFACSIGVTRDMFAILKTPQAIRSAFATAELGCTNIGESDNVIIVEVPPVRRPKLP